PRSSARMKTMFGFFDADWAYAPMTPVASAVVPAAAFDSKARRVNPGNRRIVVSLVQGISLLSATRDLGICVQAADHSALMLASLMTLPHLSASSAMNLPNSAGELANTRFPSAVSRPFIVGSVSAALISLLSLAMGSAGVPFGATMPCQPLDSKPGMK